MDFERATSRRLHAEHEATLELIGRFEALLGGRTAGWPPRTDVPATALLLRELAARFEHEIERHFEFEEAALFPRLAAAGEADIGELLGEEHQVIRAVAAPLVAMLGRAATGALTADEWQAVRTGGLELAERMVSHIQKEEMALLPALDDVLDEDADRTLAMEYAG